MSEGSKEIDTGVDRASQSSAALHKILSAVAEALFQAVKGAFSDFMLSWLAQQLCVAVR